MHVLWRVQPAMLMFILWNEAPFFFFNTFLSGSPPMLSHLESRRQVHLSHLGDVCANSPGSLALEQVGICARLKMSGLATHLFRQALNNGRMDLKYRCEILSLRHSTENHTNLNRVFSLMYPLTHSLYPHPPIKVYQQCRIK